MTLMTSWERKGREEGKQEGKEELLAHQIRRRFGNNLPQIIERLCQLSSDQLNELGEALFDFTKPAELENWFARHNPQ